MDPRYSSEREWVGNWVVAITELGDHHTPSHRGLNILALIDSRSESTP